MCLTSETSKSSWLWHACLGHINFPALKMISNKELVNGLSCIKNVTKVCE